MAKYDKDLPKTIEKTVESEIRFRTFAIRKKDKKWKIILSLIILIIISILIIVTIVELT